MRENKGRINRTIQGAVEVGNTRGNRDRTKNRRMRTKLLATQEKYACYGAIHILLSKVARVRSKFLRMLAQQVSPHTPSHLYQ